MKVERIKSLLDPTVCCPLPVPALAKLRGRHPFSTFSHGRKHTFQGGFWSLEAHSSPCRNGTARAQTRCLFPQDATVMAPVCFAASMRKGLSSIIPQGHGKSEGKLFLASPPLGFAALNEDRRRISTRSQPGCVHASCQSSELTAAPALPPCHPPGPVTAACFCDTAEHPPKGLRSLVQMHFKQRSGLAVKSLCSCWVFDQLVRGQSN